MKRLDKIAQWLDLLGIPVGRWAPSSLVADACGSFVQADYLSEHGVVIPGREWTLQNLREATISYIGLDLVNEVLDQDLHPGQTVREFWERSAQNLLENRNDNRGHFESKIDIIAENIRQAQVRLSD